MKSAFAAILVASLATARQRMTQQRLYDMVSGWADPADEADMIDLGSSEIEQSEEMTPMAWRRLRNRGVNARRLYAAGRMYDDWDEESGWDGSWKDYRDEIEALEETRGWTPDQWFQAGRDEAAAEEARQRELFEAERQTYRQTRPTFRAYLRENMDEDLMAARDGYEGEGRWWKNSDFDMEPYREAYRESESMVDWRENRPIWEEWNM